MNYPIKKHPITYGPIIKHPITYSPIIKHPMRQDKPSLHIPMIPYTKEDRLPRTEDRGPGEGGAHGTFFLYSPSDHAVRRSRADIRTRDG